MTPGRLLLVADATALFSLFPVIYTTIGAIFVFVAQQEMGKPGEELPPEFIR